MDYSQLGLFRLTAQRFRWLEQRQEVLAQNIANADTPGYLPNDLIPFERHLAQQARAGVGHLAPTVTQSGHLPGRGGGEETPEARMRDVYDVAPSGNEVVLEQQLMQVTETAMQHQMASGLYRKHLGMIRMAITRGR